MSKHKFNLRSLRCSKFLPKKYNMGKRYQKYLRFMMHFIYSYFLMDMVQMPFTVAKFLTALVTSIYRRPYGSHPWFKMLESIWAQSQSSTLVLFYFLSHNKTISLLFSEDFPLNISLVLSRKMFPSMHPHPSYNYWGLLIETGTKVC